ncbi:MAG: site-2 protease family protein [Kofleriaceae bacterium]|nr:MAG: site-2 protease family protein [Kofleriaceae bacterium]MBZ0237755.1 site-2 protease family protein [Kofleriaceae bacterium]
MDMELTPERIRWIVQGMIVLLLSVAVHEFGHAYAADRIGDRLPRRQGRVTLNPLAHADPIGTLLLPLLFLASTGGLGFGWGKPVEHTTHDRKRRVYISFAGPAMNVILGTTVAIIHTALLATGVLTFSSPVSGALFYAVMLNFVLFFFNLLPAAPLDGGSVARGLIPRSWLDTWDRIAVYAPFIVMAFILIGPLGRVFTLPARFCASKLYNLLGMIFDNPVLRLVNL